MFRLERAEVDALNRSQIVTGSQKHRDPRVPPYAFTEHGVAMLASVLRSSRAIAVNIVIVRAFVALRQFLSTQADLSRRLDLIEKTVGGHGRHIVRIYEIIQRLSTPPSTDESERRSIGFEPPKKGT